MHSLIDIEEVRKKSVASINKVFPNISVEIEDLEYSLVTSLKFHGKKLKFKLKNKPESASAETLFHLENFEIKIPIWALITNGGKIRVKGHNPVIYFDEYKKRHNNWKHAVSEGDFHKGLDVISFLTNSKINIFLYDAKIRYKLSGKNANEFLAQKLVIKNLQATNSSAFEILTHYKWKIDPVRIFESDVLVIGQVNFENYFNDGTLQSTTITTLTNNKYSRIDKTLPPIKNRLSFNLNKDGIAEYTCDIDLGEVAQLKTSGKYTKDTLSLEAFNLDLALENMNQIMNEYQLKRIRVFDFAKSHLLFKGDFSYDFGKKDWDAQIAFDTSRPFSSIFPYGLNFENSIQGTIKDKNLEMNLVSEIFDGTITTKINSKLIPDNSEKFPRNFSPLNVDLRASGLKLSKVNFKDFLYSDEQEDTSQVIVEQKKQYRTMKDYIPRGTLTLDITQTYLGDKELKLKGKLVSQENLKSQKINYSIGNGKGEILFNTEFDANNIVSTDYQFKFKKMLLKDISLFLPEYLGEVTGELTGIFSGEQIKHNNIRKNKLKVKATVLNGKISNLNFNSYIRNLVEDKNVFKNYKTNEFAKSLEDSGINNEFAKMEVGLELKNQNIIINKMLVNGKDKKYTAKGKGRIYRNKVVSQTKDSILDFSINYQNSKFASSLKNKVGTAKIPLRFSGKGISLQPDLDYTVESLINESLKSKASKYMDASILDGLIKNKKIKVNPELLKDMK
jgi:hypothetical protein